MQTKCTWDSTGKRAINKRTGKPVTAVVPVHLYGQMVDMDPILELAAQYNLKVIEDACQAHGATYKGKRTGDLADGAAFSFYPGKNLGAYGDGGAVVSTDEQVIQNIRMTANQAARTRLEAAQAGAGTCRT